MISLSLSNSIKTILNIQDNNISVTSIQRIMDDCYSDFKVNKEHLPEAICIDEFKSVKTLMAPYLLFLLTIILKILLILWKIEDFILLQNTFQGFL